MRFKNQQHRSQIPQVNLVPMMDVLMTVLTFFIIISMTLTGQRVMNVELPQSEASGSVQGSNEVPGVPLVIGFDPDGRILLENQPIDENQLAQAMQAYYTDNPDGMVLLKADRELPYDQVAKLLKTMRDIGGDRVSLAIEQS